MSLFIAPSIAATGVCVPDTSFETILLDKADEIAVITLNRPERLNAWTGRMNAELQAAISACNDDADVGAMVVTGAGRGFCAGADIRDSFKARMSRTDGVDAADDDSQAAEGTPGDWIELVRSSKPLIAAVNGASVGVGATMILPMDVIIASEDAKFGMVFVKMGVTPELGSSHFLVQRVGFGAASEMCLTARLYSGKEAFDMGLADRLVPAADLLRDAKAMARTMAANPSRHLRWVKQLLSANGSETDIAKVQRREAEVLAKAYVSTEHKEAVNAFLAKRQPVFRR